MRTTISRALLFLLVGFAALHWSAPVRLGAMDGDSPINKALGDKFASDIDRVLSENGIKSVAIFGFISQDGKDNIAEGINGLLPNEMAKVLNMRLTNLRKYKVMPTGLVASRRQQAKMTIETLEDKSAVQAFLGDDYEVMVYGYVAKDLQALESNVKVQFTLLKIINGEVTPIRMGYESYKVDDNPGTLAFLGENFPPLFITRPSGETNVNPAGMLGDGVVNGDLVEVYIRVDGKRLPYYNSTEKSDKNLLTVKLPLGCEYTIEIFDREGARRLEPGKNRWLGAAVLVDGLGTIGKWSPAQGQPADEDFMLCENPADANKWLLNGKGKDAVDEKGAPGQSTFIEGWQTSAQTSRRFVFGKTRDSLAARTNQISANLGIITVAIFKEAAGGRKGGYATGQGREFENKVTVREFRFDPEPVQVVNIRCVPVDSSGNSGDSGEGLQLITR